PGGALTAGSPRAVPQTTEGLTPWPLARLCLTSFVAVQYSTGKIFAETWQSAGRDFGGFMRTGAAMKNNLVLAVLATFAFAGSSLAQGEKVVIVGTVKDASGGVMAGVEVSLKRL